MQIWLVPGFQESTGQSSFQNFQPLVSGNKFFSWEKNWYRLGKAAAHILEEVCKRIREYDRDAERWNDFHYVTEGSENLREEAVSCLQKFHENSHRAETEGCSGKKMFVGLHIFAKCGMNPSTRKPAAHLETSQDSIYSSLI